MFNTIKDFALESITSLLAFFYSLPVVGGSYGIAIMLLTATVMTVLMPLTLKATRSTIKMTQLQPELKALQKEYKDDKQELNQAMMAMYQEHGVNPVGGCLPMVAQLPVLLVLFNVLRGLTRRVSEVPYYAIADQARALTGGQGKAPDTFDPKYLSHETELFQDLSQDTEMLFGPLDLAIDARAAIQAGFGLGLLYIILISFVVATSYYQQRQVSARRGAQPENPTQQQQTQQQLLRILPMMSAVTGFFFPAGLVLYWATSNVFRIGQQAYITRALYQEDDEGGEKLVAKGSVAKTASAANGSATDASDSAEKKDSSKSQSKSGSKGSTSKGNTSKGDTSKDGSKDKDAAEANGDGKPASSGSKNGRNGSTSDSSNGDTDRNAAWERRRAQRAKAQDSKKKIAADGGSRTTPKGTKPSAQKKKRKR
jgi:YidC/Oxa1 family membrane protein insertase